MKDELLARAALYRSSGDELQAERHERLATQCDNDDSLEPVIGESSPAFEIAKWIEADPTNAASYLKRAQLYFDTGLEPGATEWEQVERDLNKVLELGRTDNLLAEAYALRVSLRCCRGDHESNFDDLKRAVQHGATNPEVFEHLASLYCDNAKSNDAPENLDEAISLYIAGIYCDLRHDLHENDGSWYDQFRLLEGLATAYDKRANARRLRGKPVEAFEDEEKARWLRKEGRQALVEMNRETSDIELPERIASDCPLL